MIPLHEKTRNYEALSRTYKDISNMYDKIISVKNSGKRILGRYYKGKLLCAPDAWSDRQLKLLICFEQWPSSARTTSMKSRAASLFTKVICNALSSRGNVCAADENRNDGCECRGDLSPRISWSYFAAVGTAINKSCITQQSIQTAK